MNVFPRKTLSLASRPVKIVINKPTPTGASIEAYRMDDWNMDDRRSNDQRLDNRWNRPRYQGGAHDRGGDRNHDRGHHFGGQHPQNSNQDDANLNKIRRGPGRRLAKEKRIRSMDPALMQKYATLSPALQEKVNAAIEIYYQQQMAKAYKGQPMDEEPEEDHFQEDVVYEAEEAHEG